MFSPGRQTLYRFIVFSHRTEGKPFGTEKGGYSEIRQKLRRPPFPPLRVVPRCPMLGGILAAFWGQQCKHRVCTLPPPLPSFSPCSAFSVHKSLRFIQILLSRSRYALRYISFYNLLPSRKRRTCRCGLHGVGNANALRRDKHMHSGLGLRPFPPPGDTTK